MGRTTLRDARSQVIWRVEFKGSNIFARWHSSDADHLPSRHRRYVVYSYGTHFPMYIFDQDTEQWFGNSDKYSVTTSKHQSACRPPNVHEWRDTGFMQKLAAFGLIPTIQAKVLGQRPTEPDSLAVWIATAEAVRAERERV